MPVMCKNLTFGIPGEVGEGERWRGGGAVPLDQPKGDPKKSGS